MHKTFLQTSDKREKELTNDVSVSNQIMSIHAWSLESISLFALLSFIITEKWWEKGGGHNQCKGEQWILLKYILVKSWSLDLYHNQFDNFTFLQAFDVKADVDQTNREVRLQFSSRLIISLRFKLATNKCHKPSFS